MNKLYGTESVNGTQETAEDINTNNWPILTYVKNRMHNSGCGRCEMKTPQLITWNTSGKYIIRATLLPEMRKVFRAASASTAAEIT